AYAENYCYRNDTFEMRRRYEACEIGEITYAEGEYIHDTASIKPGITYGERNHWRNRTQPFFYCTHSFGPIMTITGRRPVKVVGMQSRFVSKFYEKALGPGAAALELVTLDNGALVKSIHGGLKREPGSVNYEIYGDKGCMETQRFADRDAQASGIFSKKLNVWKEGDKVCQGELETFFPQKFIEKSLAESSSGHGGSDFYATHFFIQKILGKEQGKYSIDVYTAVDMGIVGIFAHRSYLDGGKPYDIPNFRNIEEREAYRNDNVCTNSEVAGDQLVPKYINQSELPEIEQKQYDHIRRLFLAGKPYEYLNWEEKTEEELYGKSE
ncbi:MAG: hypothetical protein GX633_03490, partial [Clostridiales bacterium]|nr:hypothetical protein [Clostridiales bacterium]